MGTELSKQQGRGSGSSRRTAAAGAAAASVASTQLVVAEWHDWLNAAEVLFLQGRYGAHREALQTDAPSLPAEPMAAALLKAVAKANAAIGELAEPSLLSSADSKGRGVGRGPAAREAGSVGGAGIPESRGEASPISSLEDALREAIQVAVRATSSSSSSSSFSPLSPRPSPSSGPAAAATAAAVGLEARPRVSVAVLAAAAEDVAIQVACAAMTSRLAKGEPTKALSVGVRLLASRRVTVAAAAAATEDSAVVGSGNASARGLSKADGGTSGRRRKGSGAAAAAAASEGEGHRESDPFAPEEEEQVAARDVFWGVDALREAFGSALRGPGPGGKKLPLSEAAPRLLHLLRLSWLLAVANLALGRAAAAARIVFVAEHAYGARPSAWRKASHLIATRPPRASAAYTLPPPPPKTPHAAEIGGSGGAGRRGRGAGKIETGALLGRDPALAMCRFLRGLASLAQGDLEAAAGRLEESLDLEPSGRHATVCLAHISCFASATEDSALLETSGTRAATAACRTQRQQLWKPSSDRTNELLRLLALGTSAHFDSVEQELLLRGSGEGTGRGEKGNAPDKDGRGSTGSGIDRDGRSSSWGAFREEFGGGVEAWILLACTARATGDAGGAVSMFRRALALDPHCLEAVYGVARVLQESGDHAASRELLIFLGERSQDLLRESPSSPSGSSSAKSGPTRSGHGPSIHHKRRLVFPLGTGRGEGGVSGSLVLPAAPAEVMWRVARASMSAKDWSTGVLALRGLVTSYALSAEETAAAAVSSTAPLYYFASFAPQTGGGAGSGSPHGAPSAPASLSPDCIGPGKARALRALAFCQIQRGLYRDALETVHVGLGGGGPQGAAGGGAAEADDAALLMLRADAMLCLEEGEKIVEASLDKAAQLLNRRQIDMSLPSPPPSSSSSSSSSSRRSKRNKPTATPQQQQQQQWLPGTTAASPPTAPPTSRGGISSNGGTGGGDGGDGDAPHARATDRDRRLARSAAFNNRAVLLIASGRGEEACRLLRACLLLLPEQARPSFNLTLALWRLGRRRAASSHWLGARGWLEADGGGGGGDSGRRRASRERFTRLLESARRQKAVLQSNAAGLHPERNKGGSHGPSSSSAAAATSHVTEGQGDPLSLPRIQSCLLDIRCLTWWLDDINSNAGAGEEGGGDGESRVETRPPATRAGKRPARSLR
ncbi:unnamed protein product [Scytosiphon promiscuus]